MKILLMVAMAMLGGKAQAEASGALERANEHVAPVCMSEGVRTTEMYLARRIVSEMFAKIGVTIEWRFQERTCRSQSGAIFVRLSTDTPADQLPGDLAYALPFEGAHIVVFYDRVSASVPRSVVPQLLAHVLAHEIAHILEGTNYHSDSGVMKARWDLNDEDQMFHKPLLFSSLDVSLIHRGLEERESRHRHETR